MKKNSNVEEYDLVLYMYEDKLNWRFLKMFTTDQGYELFKKSWWGKNEEGWWESTGNIEQTGIIKSDCGTELNYIINYKNNKIYLEKVKNRKRKRKSE